MGTVPVRMCKWQHRVDVIAGRFSSDAAVLIEAEVWLGHRLETKYYTRELPQEGQAACIAYSSYRAQRLGLVTGVVWAHAAIIS
jgi:hypothetical protein